MTETETPEQYIRRFTMWTIETYGETCTGNVLVSIDSSTDEWGLEIGDWYRLVHRTFGDMVEERRIELIMHETAHWYKFPNLLDRMVAAMDDEPAELVVCG